MTLRDPALDEDVFQIWDQAQRVMSWYPFAPRLESGGEPVAVITARDGQVRLEAVGLADLETTTAGATREA